MAMDDFPDKVHLIYVVRTKAHVFSKKFKSRHLLFPHLCKSSINSKVRTKYKKY